MLRFISVPNDLLSHSRDTLNVPDDAIHPTLESAEADPRTESILVFDASAIPDHGAGTMKLTISDARNGSPFRPPVAVAAAGGYVVRSGREEREVLLIFRRGVWDLPKGKVDKGETIAAAALREVYEEVGAENLRLLASLGTTVHGYPLKKQFAVKTTHWFLMDTSSTTFTPQTEEQIEEVRWVPWSEAGDMLGFDTLRDHLAAVEF